MDWPTPNLADVLRARAALSPYLRPTPTLEPPALGASLGCRAFLKCENLNPTGAFKVRGGIYLLSTLTPEQRARGVLAVSTGNHAQSDRLRGPTLPTPGRSSTCPRGPIR